MKFGAQFRKREGSRLVAQDSHAARLLALAYWIDRRVESGACKDYRGAGRELGVGHARVSQVTQLLMLPPAVQADVLTGRADYTELTLRRLAMSVEWRNK